MAASDRQADSYLSNSKTAVDVIGYDSFPFPSLFPLFDLILMILFSFWSITSTLFIITRPSCHDPITSCFVLLLVIYSVVFLLFV